MFSKVFTTISCFWMRHWSVIPLRTPHGHPVLEDGEIWDRKRAGTCFALYRAVEADHLSEFTDEPTEPCGHLAVHPGSLPHFLLHTCCWAEPRCTHHPSAASASAQLLRALPLCHLFLLTLGLFILITKWHFRVQGPEVEELQFSLRKATRMPFSSSQL